MEEHTMNDKLMMAEARYDEIGVKLSDPTVIADNKLYRDLMREHKRSGINTRKPSAALTTLWKH